MIKQKNIFIIAGESSGDQHAAKYITAHESLNSNIKFSAIGQTEIKKTSAEVIFNSEEISVVGIIEVISKYNKILKALNIAYSHIDETKPDLIILVDYVEFNLKIANYAKSKGIKVLFYIAPQVWAWREKRIEKIINAVDHLAVVFPFEEKLFKKYTDNVTYVGHPLADNPKFKINSNDYNDKSIDIGIFPGSRDSEIKNNLHIMLNCIKLSKDENIMDKNIKIFYSNNTAKRKILSLLPKGWEDTLADGRNIEEIANCKKAITASGTITLELALLNIPMVIMYKLAFVTFIIMKSMVKVKYIGLVNLILGEKLGSKPIVKEFIQPDYNDEVQVMVELQKIDKDDKYRNEIESGYSKIRSSLQPGASKNLVALVEKIIR
tara:strand:- start:970 stop:2106 length:1137 start_codon:yes stop_codon:yes gene_type:complete